MAVADQNSLLQAARSLLVLLANLRVNPQQLSVAPLMDAVAQAITAFERRLQAAGISPQQVVTAKYALCATADDIVQNLPGGERHLWTQYSMLSRFFQARTSGVGFFDELARVKANVRGALKDGAAPITLVPKKTPRRKARSPRSKTADAA